MERLTEWIDENKAIPKMDVKRNGHQRCMNKLAKFEDMEEQGKLIELPCKPGDTVYTTYKDEDGGFVEKMIITEATNKRVLCDNRYWYSYSEFGKTVFLTEQEAKKALEGMKNGD